MRSNALRCESHPCLSHIPIQSWEIPQRLGIIPLSRSSNFGTREATMKLKQTIFGSEPFMGPNSRTYINQLYNMVTLSPDIHTLWEMGMFMLEPVDEPMNSCQQNLRPQWVPPRRSSGNINLLTNPNSLNDVTEEDLILPYNLRTGARLESGSIISVTTHDPENYPLPGRDLLRLQCNLIMVLRMASRAGGDILETYDSDSEVSSISTAIISRRNSSAHSSNQIHSDQVTPTPVPSQKISNSLLPKFLHFKDRMGEIVKLKGSKSTLLKPRLSSFWNGVRRSMRRHV